MPTNCIQVGEVFPITGLNLTGLNLSGRLHPSTTGDALAGCRISQCGTRPADRKDQNATTRPSGRFRHSEGFQGHVIFYVVVVQRRGIQVTHLGAHFTDSQTLLLQLGRGRVL